MHTFVEEMKHNYFISALLTIALGAVLVIWPDWSGFLQGLISLQMMHR